MSVTVNNERFSFDHISPHAVPQDTHRAVEQAVVVDVAHLPVASERRACRFALLVNYIPVVPRLPLGIVHVTPHT